METNKDYTFTSPRPQNFLLPFPMKNYVFKAMTSLKYFKHDFTLQLSNIHLTSSISGYYLEYWHSDDEKIKLALKYDL